MAYTTDCDEKASRALKIFLAEDDRPREKAKINGFGALSLAELLAIIIGSGTPGESVVDLCQRILREHDNKLYAVARRGFKDLMKYNGIGEVKALQILAALEIARRYQVEKFDDHYQVADSKTAYDYLRPFMEYLPHEEIWILILNRGKRVVDKVRMGTGGTMAVVGDIKLILKEAITRLADSILLAHNHPSDTAHPSRDDDLLTQRLREACQAVGIPLVDHIIVCRGGQYFSYCDHNRL